MMYAWTAETDDGQEFGGVIEHEAGDNLRPVFIKARELAVERHGDNVTVTAISYTN